MSVVVLVVILLAVGAAATIWWLLVLIEALTIPDAQWNAAGQNKILHVLVMVVLGVVGTVIYAVTARPELRRVGPPPSAQPPGYR